MDKECSDAKELCKKKAEKEKRDVHENEGYIIESYLPEEKAQWKTAIAVSIEVGAMDNCEVSLTPPMWAAQC